MKNMLTFIYYLISSIIEMPVVSSLAWPDFKDQCTTVSEISTLMQSEPKSEALCNQHLTSLLIVQDR